MAREYGSELMIQAPNDAASVTIRQKLLIVFAPLTELLIVSIYMRKTISFVFKTLVTHRNYYGTIILFTHNAYAVGAKSYFSKVIREKVITSKVIREKKFRSACLCLTVFNQFMLFNRV